MKRYNSFNDAMKSRFGCKVYKIALDGGFTCPNRDGKIGYGGCIFCSGRGSGDFTFSGESIEDQLAYGKALIKAKNPDGKFIAYYQSFTNTYESLCKLKEIYCPALESDDIIAVSIATRPDCLPDETIALLAEMNRQKPVWVELGLQTVNEKTAEYIRRGYKLAVYDDAVRRLKDAGLEVITHMIIGLPGENGDDAVITCRHIAEVGSDGIKLQLLHVLENTGLKIDYVNGKFKTLELDEYISILERCIEALPENMVIHRLTGDGAKSELIAPLWSADKKRVLNAINSAFERDDVRQGKSFR